MKKTKNLKKSLSPLYSLLAVSLLVTACSSVPKKANNIENACDILNTDESWREAFEKTFQKYGVPPHVVMAIMYQESRFVSDARPPRKKFLGVPMGRPSTAYGYAQSLDGTWDWYRGKSGNRWAKRDHLPDAVDFIGWYVQTNYDRTGVSKWDTREQYLAYHEGSGGYLKKTHNNKSWLLAVADKVARHAGVYRQQLANCYAYPTSDATSVMPNTSNTAAIDANVVEMSVTDSPIIDNPITDSPVTDTAVPYTIELMSSPTDLD